MDFISSENIELYCYLFHGRQDVYARRWEKNGNVHQYTYYHCTKKIHPNCNGKYVEEKVLIKQIASKLDKISIRPEFYAWGLDLLKKDILKNASLRNKVTENKEKQIADIDQQLSELLTLLLKKVISEEDYQNKKSELAKEKAKLGVVNNNNPNKIQRMFDRATEDFDLARDAKDEILNGTVEKRRKIVVKLGSNPSLTQRIFDICIKKALLPFESISKAVKDIHSRVEPIKIHENSRELHRLYSKSLVLRASWVKYPEILPF